MDIWQLLGIGPTKDLSEIKKAYAAKIKLSKPEIDSEGFQLLREAYERAKQYAEGQDVYFILPNSNEKFVFEEKSIHPIEEIEEEDSLEVEPLIYFLLDELQKNEDSAIKILHTMLQNKGPLDNLEFLDDFQKSLAVNLLKFTNRPKFIQYAISVFHWREHPEKDDSTFFGIALTNLINQNQNQNQKISYFFSKNIPSSLIQIFVLIIMNGIFLSYQFYFKKDTFRHEKQQAAQSTQLTKINTTVIATNLIKTNKEQKLEGKNQYRLHLPNMRDLNYKSWVLYIMNPKKEGFNTAHVMLSSMANKLLFNADGSVDIYIQRSSPGKDKEANWLIPPPGSFSVSGQFYWTENMALKAKWVPPFLEQVNGLS